ncbi:(2Fe-2S)-binding protein [Hydrogenophaga crassostreae]|uniref:(2Fe-2S)-binding protein n=1 Tax=Hydrogenophaga crassostreae TaxID=1763535 RepID=A0A167HD34_9BURK|nr:Rieske 2Fe-2S domain-containing protein [Hydrogenophaga crassostreae]AOW12046.1 (2Fe-2S)-binding protein [Hydrogenophaga crassostreae]OAD40990.1 (2Fe-2S)-binding protein [Hydrogenophaga crassostreae]
MRLCHIDDLPESGSRGFDPLHTGQDSLLLVRKGQQVFAYADSCPHHDTPMAWRKDAYLNGQGDRIVCAAHGAQFEIETGRCTLGPCLGQALTALALNINSLGEVSLADGYFQETKK